MQGLYLRSVRETTQSDLPAGRPFSPKTALLFVLVVGLALAISAHELARGSRTAARHGGFAGLADAHAAAISAASLAAGGKGVLLAAIAVLIGFSTNAMSKTSRRVLARRPALRAPAAAGNRLMVLAAWAGWFVRSLLA